MQWILSFIPWQAYVAGNGAIAAGLAFKFGWRAAIVYGSLALVFVAYDKGGDDRDAYRKVEIERNVQDALSRAERARERSDAVVPGPDGMPNDGWRRD